MTVRTIYLIHHSHTDIGYTDRQEKISRYHAAYIRDSLRFLKKIETGEMPQWKGYRYTCENFWQVEQFLKRATPDEIRTFETYVAAGTIDLSLTYLNMTELVDNEILLRKLTEAKNYTERFSRKFDSAMTADINGFSWAYAETMYQAGIRNFFSCLHTHHGMFPLFHKQVPFWWETATGNRLLVWNGDHYQLGNDFLFSPNTDQSRQFDVEGFTESDWQEQLKLTEQRVSEYLTILDQESYPFDFIPAMISGIVTDNSPTSPRMMEGIRRWNQRYQEQVVVKLVTLSEFFEELRNSDLDLPVYRGDWPDWWGDGVGSTPAATKLYRDAQRKRRLIRKLDPHGKLGDAEQLQEAENQMMLYAEHTWGFHSSVEEPWDSFVNVLGMRKMSYAVNGHQLISEELDDVLAAYGETTNHLEGENRYRIINPHDFQIKTIADIYLQHWQTVDGSYFPWTGEAIAEVVSLSENQVLPSQTSHSSRGKKISFMVDLAPGEMLEVGLRRKKVSTPSVKFSNRAHTGTELVADIASYEGYSHDVSAYGVLTKDFQLTLDGEVGIRSLWHLPSGRELIHPQAEEALFSGIYEVTPSDGDPCGVRRKMGRNRKSPATRRSFSSLKDLRLLENGPVYAKLLLSYTLVGTKMYDVELTVYKEIPRIDSKIRLQKEIEWAPENLYVALPLTLGTPIETTCYLEKSGGIMRPGIDQLPGTNTSFYLVDSGVYYTNQDQQLFVAVKDTPLVTFGPMTSQLVALCTPESHLLNRNVMYSWVMNNFWETNFNVDLAGFYEFEYVLYLPDVQSEVAPATAIAKAQVEGVPVIAFKQDTEKKEN